jgi:hypothetical protein
MAPYTARIFLSFSAKRWRMRLAAASISPLLFSHRASHHLRILNIKHLLRAPCLCAPRACRAAALRAAKMAAILKKAAWRQWRRL